MQKGSDCEIFPDLVYFMLKFPKRVNYSYFHQSRRGGDRRGCRICEPILLGLGKKTGEEEAEKILRQF
jgi:hypothetical protein